MDFIIIFYNLNSLSGSETGTLTITN